MIRPCWGKMLERLKENELILVLIILLFFDSIQATLRMNGFEERGYGFLHALIMLSLGYGISQIKELRFNRLIGLVIYISPTFLAGIMSVFEKNIWPNEVESKVLLYNSPLIILVSLGLFCVFLSIIVEVKILSKLRSHFFTIYLINDQPEMREYFWKNVLHCNEMAESNGMVIY